MQRVDIIRLTEGSLESGLVNIIAEDRRIVQVLELSAIKFLVISEPTGD